MEINNQLLPQQLHLEIFILIVSSEGKSWMGNKITTHTRILLEHSVISPYIMFIIYAQIWL